MNSCLGLLGRRPDRLCQVNESVIGGARRQQLHLYEVTVALCSEGGGGHVGEDGRDLWRQGSVYTEKGLGAEDRTHTHAHKQTTEIKTGVQKRHAFIETTKLGLRVSLQMQTKDSAVKHINLSLKTEQGQ